MKLLDLISEYFLNEVGGPYEQLSSVAKEVAQDIMKALDLSKEEIGKHARNRIIVRSDKPRAEIFKALEDMGFERDPDIVGSNPGGFRTENGIEIIHKPFSAEKSVGNAGIGNEMAFIDGIKSFLEQKRPLDVVLKGKNKSTTIKGVTEVVHIGKEGESKGWKGDARLIAGGKEVNISIKLDGGYRWESVIKRYRDVFETVLKKGLAGEIPNLELRPSTEKKNLLLMMNPNNNKAYGRIFITGHPDLEKDSSSIHDMAFGPDNAIIVQRSFTEGDFSLSGNTLTVTCSKVLETVDDFEDDDFPVIEFERNASKASKADKDPNDVYGRGIVMRTRPAGQAKGTDKANYLYLDYNDVMK